MQLHKKPLVFTMANRKGGVGKTTNTVNLAFAYSQLGYNVLVIDADPQGSLTQTLGIDRSIGSSPELTINNITQVSKQLRERSESPYQIDDLFGNPDDGETTTSEYYGLHDLMSKAFYGEPISKKDVDDAIMEPSYKIEKSKRELQKMKTDEHVTMDDLDAVMYNYYKFGFDLMPSAEELTDDELLFTLDADPSRRNTKGLIMTRVVQAVANYRNYDIILIDTGPSLGILTVNAMAAATDGMIVSVSVDEQSLWSLQKFKFNIRQIKQMIPGHEGVLGVILAPYESRSQLTPIIADKIKNVLHMYLFDTKIPKSTSAAKAVASGVLFSMINDAAYDAYISLAKEILARNQINHDWETERNLKVNDTIDQLKKTDRAYLTMKQSDILQVVRNKYSDGDLWKMPDSDYEKDKQESIRKELDEEEAVDENS